MDRGGIRMLFELSGRILPMHEETEVRDVCRTLVYRSHSKMRSSAEKSAVMDGEGREIAKFYKKAFSLHQIHTIELLGGELLTMKAKLLRPFKDVIEVEENGWELKGNFSSRTYQILDQDGKVLAMVTRPWQSVRDRCRIDVKEESKADQLVVLIIVLEHMLMDRRSTEEATAGEGAGAGRKSLTAPGTAGLG